MQQRESALNNIRNRLAETRHAIELDQAIQHYTLNGVAENYWRDLLNFVYGYQLENANFTQPNAAYVDLVDTGRQIAFQITSTTNVQKIRHTLEGLHTPDYAGYQFRIFYLLDKPKLTKITSKTLETEFGFLEAWLLDSEDFLCEINNLEIGKLRELNQRYFTKPPEKVVHVHHNSTDWQTLNKAVQQAESNVRKYPNDPDFQQQLKEARENRARFERDVLHMTELFSHTKLDTERLRQAKQYFEQGKYQLARDILDSDTLRREQREILDDKQFHQNALQKLERKAEHNARELGFKARLTAIDYNLGAQRIPQTKALFEDALRSDYKSGHIAEYADFLAAHYLFEEAEIHYRKVLEIDRSAAEANPEVEQPNLMSTLNSLARLLSDAQPSEAIVLYQEALDIGRQLAKAHPDVYSGYVATVLNNLATMDGVADDLKELWCREALGIRRRLAATLPDDYRAEVATTLSNLANILSNQAEAARSETEELYREAISIHRNMIPVTLDAYYEHAAVQNNFAVFLSSDPKRWKEAAQLWHDALLIRRHLADLNPEAYRPDVADTLRNLAMLYGQQNQLEAALTAFEEAATILAPFAQVAPALYAEKQRVLLSVIQALKQQLGR